MRIIKNIVCLGLLICNCIVFAQEKNVFLDRAYWKSNPCLDQVKEKIKEGHDATKLNKFQFDAVSWALIEKVDNETVK